MLGEDVVLSRSPPCTLESGAGLYKTVTCWIVLDWLKTIPQTADRPPQRGGDKSITEHDDHFVTRSDPPPPLSVMVTLSNEIGNYYPTL